MFTIQNIIDDAEQYLRDVDNTNWDTDLLPVVINDVIEIMRHIVEKIDPSIIWASGTINLNAVTGYGPYNLDATAENIVMVLNSNNVEVKRGSRSSSNHNSVTAEPTQYWLEGFGPIKMFFNYTPGQSYTFTYWYIPAWTRTSAQNDAITLPDYFRKIITTAVVKICGQIDEYITMDEDQRMNMMMPLISDKLSSRAQEIGFEMEGVDF